MIIDNPDVFKTWLTSILEPLCDADPAALAKYVYALVKKDKPLEDLRDGMLDQLDVFLQQETKPFVELLFRTLESQEYLKLAEKMIPTSSTNVPTDALTDTEPANTLLAIQHDKEPPLPPTPKDSPSSAPLLSVPPPSAPLPSAPIPPSAPRQRVVLNRGTAHPPPPLMQDRRPAYATEQTLVKVLPDLLEDGIEHPPVRQRRDRRNDSMKQGWDREDRRRRRSRSRSWERGSNNRRGGVRRTWRNNSPPTGQQPRHERRVERYFSRSPSPVATRGRYRNRSPPPGGAIANHHASSRSRSRSPPQIRERERDRQSRDRERERDRQSRERERERISPRDHRDRLSRERERDRSRERSRGSAGTPTQDSNPGDCSGALSGGNTLSSLAALFPKKRCRDFDEKGYCMRGDMCQWDHGVDPVVLEDAALSRVLNAAPPAVPEYNPLAPDIWAAPRYPPGVPPGMPPFAGVPLHPPPPHPPIGHHPPQRELISIPRIDELPPNNGITIPPVPGVQPLPPTIRPPHPHPHLHPHQHSHMMKKNFDYNRIGNGRKGPPGSMGPINGSNCSLELKKVPRGLNDITHLNNHFGKFGRIVNIQVCYEGDPEAALITFSSHTEANVAYKSTEAVLNNRFIKVFWHNTESKQENVPPGGTNATNVPADQVTNGNNNNFIQQGRHNKVLINKDNMKATAAVAEANKAAAAEANLAKANDGHDIQANTQTPGDKPKEHVLGGGVNKRKLANDVRRRAQLLLQTQLAQQKLLIQKLESGNVAGPQREAIIKAIKTAQDGIENLRKELVSNTKTVTANVANAQDEKLVTGSLSKLRLTQGTALKKVRSKEEAQKDILDAELDLITRQKEGQDVSELQRRVAELRRQQMALSHNTQVVRRPNITRNPHAHRSTRFTRTNSTGAGGAAPSGNKVFINQSVDHRPKALLVSGFENDEVEAVVTHFAKFGEIVSRSLDEAVPALALQFKARAQAEVAAVRGRHYNDLTLTVTWLHPSSQLLNHRAGPQQKSPAKDKEGPSVSQEVQEQGEPETKANEVKEAEVMETVEGNESVGESSLPPSEMAEDALLQDDEEEEEEENRSWRR